MGAPEGSAHAVIEAVETADAEDEEAVADPVEAATRAKRRNGSLSQNSGDW